MPFTDDKEKTGYYDTDFWYGTGRYHCNHNRTPRDLEVGDPLSKKLVLFVVATAVWLIMRNRKELSDESEEKKEESSTNKDDVIVDASKKSKRQYHMDFARVVCSACVVTEHCGGAIYSDQNTVMVLHWTLPFLFTTSGAAFYMSKVPIAKYCGRLLTYVVIGCSCNLLGWVLAGSDEYKRNPADIFYHIFYLVFLIAGSMICYPLRLALRNSAAKQNDHVDEQGSSDYNPTACRKTLSFYGSICLCFFMLDLAEIGSGSNAFTQSSDTSWMRFNRKAFENVPFIVFSFTLIPTLAALACHVNACHSGWIGWILFGVLYSLRVVAPFDMVGHQQNVSLFMIALFTQAFPLKGAQSIGEGCRNYWPFVLILAIVAPHMPLLKGRCDLFPPIFTWHRIRYYWCEFLIVSLFTCKGFSVSDPWGWMHWLNNWAVFAYLMHEGIRRALVPLVKHDKRFEPLASLLVFGASFVFWLLHKREKHKLYFQELTSATAKTGEEEALTAQHKVAVAEYKSNVVAGALPPGEVPKRKRKPETTWNFFSIDGFDLSDDEAEEDDHED